MKETEKPLLITVKHGEKISGLGHTTISELIRQGKLESVKVGRRRLIKYASLERLAKDGVA